MTTKEKLELLLNEANDDFSNVEWKFKSDSNDYYTKVQKLSTFCLLLSDNYELRIKELL